MELVSELFLSKRVSTKARTESPLTEIGRAFEHLFNIKLEDIHKKHECPLPKESHPAEFTNRNHFQIMVPSLRIYQAETVKDTKKGNKNNSE